MVLAAIVIGVLVTVVGVAVYERFLPSTPGPPFPVIWSLGRADCPQCGPSTIQLAANASHLYVLVQQNITFFSDVTYELSAYNWSTGQPVWPSIPISVGEGVLGSFEQSLGGHAELLAEGGVVLMVTFGTQIQVPEGLFSPPPSPGGPVPWVLEWNATTGAFVLAQPLVGVPGTSSSLYVAADGGWLAVDVVGAMNFTVSTFQIAGGPSAYGAWNTTVSTAGVAPALVEGVGLTMSAGWVSVAVMGNPNFAALLNGRSGDVVWEGVLPNLYTVPGNATGSLVPSVVGEFTNVVRVGASFYYIASELGSTSLDTFNASTNTTTAVANLTGLVDPLNSDLSLLGDQTLVVTDAGAEHYWAFSRTGAALWNLSLALDQVASTGNSGVQGIDLAPMPLGGGAALVCSKWSSDYSNYEGSNYPVSTFTIPLAVVDWATGHEVWSSSYTQSESLGPDQTYPATYWPLLTQGKFAAFAYYPGNGLGWILSVTEFEGVPSG